MGGIISSNRNDEGIEQMDYNEFNAYKYPPKSGNYFGSHFFMGGERFDAVQPEAFLFGDNMDLNYLGSRPYPFPYHVTVGSEPSKALRGFINVRKDSLRFVKVQENEDETEKVKYSLEFVVDADLPFCVSIHMFAKEETIGGVLSYTTTNEIFSSPVYRFPAGYTQLFCKDDFHISPTEFEDCEWSYKAGSDVLPLVIHCYVEKEHLMSNPCVAETVTGSHGHVTLLALEKSGEAFYSLRLLKQKQIIDGLPYVLQEIYGLEEWARNHKDGGDGDGSDDESATDCVVCMSEMRDTLILPCRHMCLCSTCAESLRYQASACPICRAPFRALLQVRGLRRIIPISAGRMTLPTTAVQPQQSLATDCHERGDDNGGSDGEADREMEVEDEEGPSQTPSTPSREIMVGCRTLCTSPLPSKPAPPGYEAVPLMELLSSGWIISLPPPRPNPFIISPDGESAHLDLLLGRSQAFIRRSRSGIPSCDGGSIRAASLLRSNSSRRSIETDQCNLSIESGSLRSRASKKKANKKRSRAMPITSITSTDIASKAAMAATLLSPRSIDVTVAGATGVSPLHGDCEVIELTPATLLQRNENPTVETIKIELQRPRDGFYSVELQAPGVENAVAVDMACLENVTEPVPELDLNQLPTTGQSEEDSSLSSTTSGRALLSGKNKPF